SLVENAPDTIFTLDREHRVTYLSRSRIGPAEDLIGRVVYDLLPVTSHEDYRAAVNCVFTEGSPSQLELQNVLPGTASAWFSIRFAPIREGGQVVEVTAISSDITERKRAEEALRASEEQYRELFENNPHPMWLYDMETLAFLAVNDVAVHQYGYSREEF